MSASTYYAIGDCEASVLGTHDEAEALAQYEELIDDGREAEMWECPNARIGHDVIRALDDPYLKVPASARQIKTHFID